MKIGNGYWLQGECLETMNRMKDNSFDMILCDLPYGTTACKWDTIIPFEPLWKQYHRVVKERAAIVLTASQPFTSALIMSNVKNFKYDWSWNKNRPSGVAQAKNMPLKQHEQVCVFSQGVVTHQSQSEKRMNYFPQGLLRIDKTCKNRANDTLSGGVGSRPSHKKEYTQEFTNYPKSYIDFKCQTGFHPTQKPVALFEYLIKTYTNEGDTVLDNCAGSGTTAIACENTGRKWVCIEREPDYSAKAIERIKEHIK